MRSARESPPVTRRRAGIIFPRLSDPRWIIVAFLFTFVVYALNSPAFSRHPSQFVAALLVCTALDSALCWWYQGVRLFPMSGIVTSAGTLLLCDSPHVWPYAFVAAASVLSKHFIRV